MGGNAFSKNVGDGAAGLFARKKAKNYSKLQEESGDSAFKTDHERDGIAGDIAGDIEEDSHKEIEQSFINYGKRSTRTATIRQAFIPKSIHQTVKARADAKLTDKHENDTHGKDSTRKEGNIFSRLLSRRQPAPREPSFRVISSTVISPDGSLARLYRDAERYAAEVREVKELEEAKEAAKSPEYHEYAWEPPSHMRQYVGANEVNRQDQYEQDQQDQQAQQDMITPAPPYYDDNEIQDQYEHDEHDINNNEVDVSAQIDQELAGDCDLQQFISSAQCASCFEYFTWAQCPLFDCGHHYCGGCINGLFTRSMVDDQLFPPRCCRNAMSVEGVRVFLSDDLVQRYYLRKLEFATTDRTYCHNKDCVTFIDPATIVDKAATCQNCSLVTCTDCKRPSHEGSCPPDATLDQFLQVADENGWKRCPQCGMMIELTSGCNHVTCDCGQQFCYICTAPWRTCHCIQFEPQNLVHRARDLFADVHAIEERLRHLVNDHQASANNWDELPYRELVADDPQILPVLHFIMNRHECDHDVWFNWPGGANCMVCEHRVTTQVYRCRRCLLRVCENCRNNRL